jgi:co-chaperonin GroES (HSP10)
MEVLGNRVVIEKIKLEEKTESGIVLARTSHSDNLIVSGKVLAIGTEVEKVKVGDIVFWEKMTDMTVKLPLWEDEVLFVPETFIIAHVGEKE